MATLETQEERNRPEELNEMMFAKRGCCFWLPCFQSKTTVGSIVWWERIRTAENNNNEEKWWKKGFNALIKVREWSEIIAGPKWKTFIRRFNKNNRDRNGGGAERYGKYQYDPLSYSLNFDEGPGQNGKFDDDDLAFRDFSHRYASIPISAKSSMDLGKDGPTFS
ncbi:hypothetical protein IFM89_032146 [Coptis chinensis]|uniref:Uncharacterized protein n=1 Tax=Coptis chinensis TaxID=261450 RepID=A0A835J1N4_9MAGN|nr:hypothetical protein IFM89_032146 [Coptis chinensis]